MADNYLENKMEAYRSGKLAAAHSAARHRSGTLTPGLHLSFPPLAVLVVADDGPAAEPFAEVFRHAGLSVCLLCRRGGAEAVKTAQRHGCRLYPDDATVQDAAADIARTYKREAACIVNLGSEAVAGAIVPAEAAAGTPPRLLARQLLFLLHPENRALFCNQSLFLGQIGQK